MPPLQWLMTFNTVMEEGSFAAAARRLSLTPSAISHQMRALEHRLDRVLFLRNRRIIVPTEEAVAYAASIAESFARLETATNRLVANRGARRLAVHCSPSFATLWLTPRLHEFLHTHPLIDITLFASHEPARLGQDGVMVDIQYARPIQEKCEAIDLGEEMILPLASPDFLRRHGLTAPQDIARVPLIHSLRCVVPWEQWAARHAPRTPLHVRSLQFDRAHLALAAAADGLGLVLESTLQAHGHLQRGTLVAPFGAAAVPIVAHRIVYRREDRDDADIRAFAGWIARLVAEEMRAANIRST